MNSLQKGIVFVSISAVVYGVTPTLTRIAYDEGTNSVTVAFLRAFLALPFLFMIMKIQKIPFATSAAEKRDLALAGLAIGATSVLLYSSYNYIPVGEATTLFYIYPALVSLSCVLFYKEKLTKTIITALSMSFAGVLLVSENLSFKNVGSGGLTGFLLALASGFTFAFHVVYVDKSSLRRIPAPKITFAICVMAALTSGIYGGSRFGGGLSFDLSPKGWVYACVVALFGSLVAIVLLQAGIKYTGATTAAIISTLEPITSVLCGAIFLGENLSLPKVIGCACIVASVILVTTAGGATFTGTAPS